MKEIAPNSVNFNIGGATFMFQISKTGGFIDFGTLKENQVKMTTDTGEVKTARSGVERLQKRWTKSQTMSIRIVSEEMVKRIMQLATASSAPAAGTQAASSLSGAAFVAKLDRWVSVGKFNISTVVLTNAAATVTFTVGTDYEVDASLGMIRCLSTGTITADQACLVSAAYAVMTAKTQMSLMQTNAFTGDAWLKWTAENGGIYGIYIPSIQCFSDSTLNMGVNDPMNFGFNFDVLFDTTATSGTENGIWYEFAAAA